MSSLELILGILLLGGIPTAITIAIIRKGQFWPLCFLTFFGTTISVINFRMAAELAAQSQLALLNTSLPLDTALRATGWLVAAIILSLGLRKLLRLRKAEALRQLWAQEDDS